MFTHAPAKYIVQITTEQWTPEGVCTIERHETGEARTLAAARDWARPRVGDGRVADVLEWRGGTYYLADHLR